jgi:hypothetical protein
MPSISALLAMLLPIAKELPEFLKFYALIADAIESTTDVFLPF